MILAVAFLLPSMVFQINRNRSGHFPTVRPLSLSQLSRRRCPTTGLSLHPLLCRMVSFQVLFDNSVLHRQVYHVSEPHSCSPSAGLRLGDLDQDARDFELLTRMHRLDPLHLRSWVIVPFLLSSCRSSWSPCSWVMVSFLLSSCYFFSVIFSAQATLQGIEWSRRLFSQLLRSCHTMAA